ncbi:MAG TPA: pyridoxamine 5'-phosphate oxidase family protein [Candidatus Limnocylindrales bacterium]
MTESALPAEVEAVLRQFYTCEFTTVNRQGQPLTWPSVPYFDPTRGTVTCAVSIAFAAKAYNARRHPQVSLLFSDATGSQLVDPPAVLIQGEAEVAEVLDYIPAIIGLFKTVSRRQPESRRFTGNRIVRRLFIWYLFQRLSLTVTPRRILYWPNGDFDRMPTEIEMAHAI